MNKEYLMGQHKLKKNKYYSRIKKSIIKILMKSMVINVP